MPRNDGRAADELRPITMQTGFIEYPEGSVLVSFGKTRVLCNLSIEPGLPGWLRQRQNPMGWITAEYALLPRSTHTRTARETRGLKGRTQEIRRFIGRSLRAAVRLDLLGERTCILDCDVLQADGGTRTAAVTGGYVALALGLRELIQDEILPPTVLRGPVTAISAGLVKDQVMLDLSYEEDSAAEVDLNLVIDHTGRFIEIQGTAEGQPFARETLDALLDIGLEGLAKIQKIQERTLQLDP